MEIIRIWQGVSSFVTDMNFIIDGRIVFLVLSGGFVSKGTATSHGTVRVGEFRDVTASSSFEHALLHFSSHAFECCVMVPADTLRFRHGQCAFFIRFLVELLHALRYRTGQSKAKHKSAS